MDDQHGGEQPRDDQHGDEQTGGDGGRGSAGQDRGARDQQPGQWDQSVQARQMRQPDQTGQPRRAAPGPAAEPEAEAEKPADQPPKKPAQQPDRKPAPEPVRKPPVKAAAPRRSVWQRLRSAAAGPPPGPTRPGFWRSPLRGPWLTSVFGAILLVGLIVVFVTGLLSYAAYNPDLAPQNDQTPDKGILGFYLFPWPTSPYWLYRVTQGIHVVLGLVLIPVLLAKLWSVIPKLFEWPPVRSLGHALDRLFLLLLVGGAIFEFVTGVLNIQLDYIFPGSFYPLHFYGAWVFFAAFVVHVAIRFPRMWRALRGRRLRDELRTPTTATRPEPPDDTGLISSRPATPTLSRRGVLGLVGLGSFALLVTSLGQSIGGPLRRTAFLAPHGREPGSGPNGFQINKTAASRGIRAQDTGPNWRLVVRGAGREVVLSRDQLLALPQRTSALPIACVEGWSTTDQLWSGVRLADLAGLVGAGDRPPAVFVESLQRSGAFRAVTLRNNQVRDPRSLLALRVNGADLSPDHGYPARVIVPNNPGVNNTKWVTRLTFREPA